MPVKIVKKIWLIFFLFLQTKPSFAVCVLCPSRPFLPFLFQSLLSLLRKLSTYILLDFKVVKWAVFSLKHSSNPNQVNIAKNSQCTGSEKTSEKKTQQIFKGTQD
jgi:hypothetical protein